MASSSSHVGHFSWSRRAGACPPAWVARPSLHHPEQTAIRSAHRSAHLLPPPQAEHRYRWQSALRHDEELPAVCLEGVWMVPRAAASGHGIYRPVRGLPAWLIRMTRIEACSGLPFGSASRELRPEPERAIHTRLHACMCTRSALWRFDEAVVRESWAIRNLHHDGGRAGARHHGGLPAAACSAPPASRGAVARAGPARDTADRHGGAVS